MLQMLERRAHGERLHGYAKMQLLLGNAPYPRARTVCANCAKNASSAKRKPKSGMTRGKGERRGVPDWRRRRSLALGDASDGEGKKR